MNWPGLVSAQLRWLGQVQPKPKERERERERSIGSLVSPNPTKSGWTYSSPPWMVGSGPTQYIK